MEDDFDEEEEEEGEEGTASNKYQQFYLYAFCLSWFISLAI